MISTRSKRARCTPRGAENQFFIRTPFSLPTKENRERWSDAVTVIAFEPADENSNEHFSQRATVSNMTDDIMEWAPIKMRFVCAHVIYCLAFITRYILTYSFHSSFLLAHVFSSVFWFCGSLVAAVCIMPRRRRQRHRGGICLTDLMRLWLISL